MADNNGILIPSDPSQPIIIKNVDQEIRSEGIHLLGFNYRERMNIYLFTDPKPDGAPNPRASLILSYLHFDEQEDWKKVDVHGPAIIIDSDRSLTMSDWKKMYNTARSRSGECVFM